MRWLRGEYRIKSAWLTSCGGVWGRDSWRRNEKQSGGKFSICSFSNTESYLQNELTETCFLV